MRHGPQRLIAHHPLGRRLGAPGRHAIGDDLARVILPASHASLVQNVGRTSWAKCVDGIFAVPTDDGAIAVTVTRLLDDTKW